MARRLKKAVMNLIYEKLASIGAGEFNFDASADISAAMGEGKTRDGKQQKSKSSARKSDLELLGRNNGQLDSSHKSIRSSRYDPSFDQLAEDIMASAETNQVEAELF